ncbi:MAG: PAS domain S-box protein [Ginsengibacter sp.]
MIKIKTKEETSIPGKCFALGDEGRLTGSGHNDVTQNSENEQYARHLAAIVKFSDDAIFSKSLDGIIKSWNKGGEKMFGYTASQAVGKNISLIIPDRFITEEQSILQRICNNEIIEHFETIRRKKNGQEFYVSLTVSPLKNSEGKITGVSKIVRDITSGKRAEAQLINSNKELVFQNSEKEKRAAELIIANKELVFQNSEKEKRAAELIVANKELVFQNGEKEKRAGELVISNEVLVFQNGEKEKRAAEVIVANKELAFQNLEKEKRAAELIIANKELAFQNDEKEKRAIELEIVNRELESFSYSVSHDLRAPLRAINGFTQVLIEEYIDQFNEDAKGLLDVVVANSKKMGQLIDNLLEFSRVGKKPVTLANINIRALVDAVINELKATEPERVFIISINPLENINGDRNMLKQVWINLISNAFKYTSKKQNAVIEIGSYRENDQCIYYVKDNGAGFDMQYYDKMFGVFQRLHSNNDFEGTGVGLAIILKIITKHNGKVWAEGRVDEGACFYISLPVIN